MTDNHVVIDPSLAGGSHYTFAQDSNAMVTNTCAPARGSYLSACAHQGHSMGEGQLLYQDGVLVGYCSECGERLSIRNGDSVLLHIYLEEARQAAVSAMCSDRRDENETMQILTRFADLEETTKQLLAAAITADDLLKMAKKSLLKRVS